MLRPVFSVNSKTIFCGGTTKIFLITANFSWSYLSYQSFVMFKFEYAQIIKIRGFVSLQTTATSESSLEPCNTKRVSVSLWVQLLITRFPAGERKYSFSLEVIIKEVGLDRIPEPNYSAYCFTVSIK